MADFSLVNRLRYTDKNHAGDISAGNVDDGELVTDADSLGVIAARTRLLAIGGFYTATTLNQMTYNDMLYALRVNDLASTI